MIYTDEQLKQKVLEMMEVFENEVVEFKEASNNYNFNDIGKYFSALGNEANIRGKNEAWLVFGISNKKEILGTNYRSQGSLQNLKREILNVLGDYEPVNPETDGALNPQPVYMEYWGKWMEEGMENTAPDYNAQIQIDYKDQNQTLNITGNLNNKYDDVVYYNDFITNTTLTHGKDSYVINGQVNTADLSKGYTVTKNGEADNFVINENLHGLIMTALRIDLANNSISGDAPIYSVAQDSETLKIKVENQHSEGFTTVYFVFDAEGNFVGHKVSVTSVDGTMSYSIQMKLAK